MFSSGKKKGVAFRLDVRPLFYYELLYFYTASSRTQEFVNLSISVGGDGEISRDGEAGAGSGRDRRRGRMKGARLRD